MKRSQAEKLIDQIRWALAMHDREPDQFQSAVRFALEASGLKPLEPCEGEAHTNPHIDHCGRCAPRWGFVGPKESVT